MIDASATPREHESLGHGAWLLAVVAAGLCGLYLCFYPPTYSIMDEQGYLSYALVLAEGTLHPDETSVRVLRSRYVPEVGQVAPSFPIGTSALFALVLPLGWRAAFAVVMVLHLVGTALCAHALRRLQLPALWAVLYLLHPVAILYSRTAMSDVPTMALTMAAVAAWCGPRRHAGLAGLALGASLHFRYAQLALLGAFGAAVAIRDLAQSRRTGRIDVRRTLAFGLGALPGAIGLVVWSTWLYGSPLPTAEKSLALSNLASNLPRYLLSQNLVYPGALLVATCLRSPLRLECALAAVATLLLYGSFFHRYTGFGALQQILIGDRFFLPLAAFVIPAYASVLARFGARLPRPARTLGAAAGIAALLVGAAAIHLVHQRRLDAQARIQATLYERTPEGALVICSNLTSFEYFFDGLGARTPLLFAWLAGDRPGGDPEILDRIDASLRTRGVFVLAAQRTDRSGRDARRDDEMLRWVRERYVLRLVHELDRPPDRLQLYRIVTREPGFGALPGGAGAFRR